MAAFYYTALRDVMSGHTVSNSYSFDGALSAMQRKPKVIKKDIISLGGNIETVVSRREVFVKCSSILEDGANAEQWLEFLSSVDGGEQFQADLTGTIASPGTLNNAILHKDFIQSFVAGSNSYKFSFTLRLI
jgi:hypothetical protein